MPVRDYVDFSLVEDAHREIDARLLNWGRWAQGGRGAATCPMFRLYRPSHAREEYGAATVVRIDSMDAVRIQKAVRELPSRHRLAVSWNYVKRDSPKRAAQTLGESLAGLHQLVRDGRQMLINRRA